MSLSVVRVERTLDDIADSVRVHWAATEDDRFAIGRDLMEARTHFPDNLGFGRWCEYQGFPFSRQWAHTLRLAAENEPKVRLALSSQLDNGKPANFEKALRTVLHPEPSVTEPQEEPPIDPGPEWASLVSVMDAIEALSSIDAALVAATVPFRRRAATAKRLRKLGTYLGRIAWTIEGSEEQE